ncbi:MAG: hypothetical protein EZS28_047736, partial [Streblomastix strix]
YKSVFCTSNIKQYRSCTSTVRILCISLLSSHNQHNTSRQMGLSLDGKAHDGMTSYVEVI